ncbi:MAG: HRDC domain-containing protein [Lachnospiraceae bacterium]|nr:HRDC domain-containing protein [Lachnospiraceae bacterium]
MYKYDIPYPKKDQYALLINNFPINVAKSISYLKTKMKAHRDEYGSEEECTYTIVTPDLKPVYTRTFKKGEEGNSKKPYHIIGPKPDIKYKEVYLYRSDSAVEATKREDEHPVLIFEAICDEDGIIITDLELLRILARFRWLSTITVNVSNKALVDMATYMPLDKESFLKLHGTGEKMYVKCGEQFITVIKEYMNEK